MSYKISVENVKCGGCANIIMTKLNSLDEIKECQVDIDSGVVSIDGDESFKSQISQQLADLGYPEK